MTKTLVMFQCQVKTGNVLIEDKTSWSVSPTCTYHFQRESGNLQPYISVDAVKRLCRPTIFRIILAAFSIVFTVHRFFAFCEFLGLLLWAIR